MAGDPVKQQAALSAALHVSGEVDAPVLFPEGKEALGPRAAKPGQETRTSWLLPASARRQECREGAVVPSMEAVPLPLHRAGEEWEHQGQKLLADWVRDGAPHLLKFQINDHQRRPQVLVPLVVEEAPKTQQPKQLQT